MPEDAGGFIITGIARWVIGAGRLWYRGARRGARWFNDRGSVLIGQARRLAWIALVMPAGTVDAVTACNWRCGFCMGDGRCFLSQSMYRREVRCLSGDEGSGFGERLRYNSLYPRRDRGTPPLHLCAMPYWSLSVFSRTYEWWQASLSQFRLHNSAPIRQWGGISNSPLLRIQLVGPTSAFYPHVR